MLKKSLFSSAQPQRDETRFSPCGVLAALRGSTYRSVRLASSLAAALLDDIFEQPAWCTPVILDVQTSEIRRPHSVFPQPARSNRGAPTWPCIRPLPYQGMVEFPPATTA